MRVAVRLEVNRFDEIAARLPGAVARRVETSARAIEADMKTNMAAQPSPSTPGEYPAVDTGAYINSIQVDDTRADGTQKIVFTNMEYGPFLEYGTERMAARPHMTPSAERERGRFVAAMQSLERDLA